MKVIVRSTMCCIAIFISSCSENIELDKPELTEKEIKGFTKEWVRTPSEKYPDGYLDVVFGDVHIKVPEPYTGMSYPDRDFFDVVSMYPSMLSPHAFSKASMSDGIDPAQDVVTRTKQSMDKIIRIMFHYKDNSFSDDNRNLERFHSEGRIKSVLPSATYPGLIEHSRGIGSWFYVVDNSDYLNNKDEPIVFGCHTGATADTPEYTNSCIWHLHVEDVSIRVNFRQSHLRDWKGFVRQISAFIESMVVSGQKVTHLKTN